MSDDRIRAGRDHVDLGVFFVFDKFVGRGNIQKFHDAVEKFDRAFAVRHLFTDLHFRGRGFEQPFFPLFQYGYFRLFFAQIQGF